MESLYNAKLTFNGEGNFTFTLPGYGDLTIYEGKDIYVDVALQSQIGNCYCLE